VRKNRDFSYACAAILLMSAVFFAAMLYLPEYMLKVLDFTPLEAGAGMLPMMGMFAAVSFIAGPLYERVGAKVLLVIGSGCIAAGPFLVSIYVSDESYASLIPGLAIMGAGIGLFYPTATTVGVTAVQEARRSLAGAIVYMFQIAGGSVGLGLTTTVLLEASDHANSGPKFVDGLETAFRTDSLIAVGGFLIAVFLIGGLPKMFRVRHHHLVHGPTPRGHGP